MAYKIEDVEGIGPAYGKKLSSVGLETTDDLLEKAGSRKGRKELAESTGISESLILTWVNHSDLFRIKGIAGQFAELLEATGVDTVKEFRNRNSENLHAKLKEVNEAKNLSGRVPSLEGLTDMIEQAKALDPKVSY